MTEQNKKIEDYVEISLTPFKKTDGSVILISASGDIIELTDPDGNLTLILNEYYKKTQTYSQDQVNSIFNNYYTKSQADNRYVIAGLTNSGPIIINDSSSKTATLSEISLKIEDSSGYDVEYLTDSIVFSLNSVTNYQPTSYKVSNNTSDLVVFQTDANGNFKLRNGTTYVNEISDDGTFTGNSDLAIPTEKATKTYVDTIFSGTVPVTGSTTSFNVNGNLTFSSNVYINGNSNPNGVTMVSGTSGDAFNLYFENANSDSLSQFIIKPFEVQVQDASGATMLKIEESYITAQGITLSEGDIAKVISSETFGSTSGSFVETEIIPTQKGVRDFVDINAVTTYAGGTVGISGEVSTTITSGGVTVCNTSGCAEYSAEGINITTTDTTSASIFSISVNNSDSIRVTSSSEFGLANGIFVNNISNETDFTNADDETIPTQAAVKAYVNEIANINTQSVAGTSYTVPISAGEIYVGCDTTSGPFTVTLPTTVTLGLRVWVKDEKGNASVNNITVDGNGNDIDDLSTNIMSVDNISRIFIYTANDWRVFSI